MIIELTKMDFDKAERTTAVTRDLGFRQTLKWVLYLKVQSLTESIGFLNPTLLQAAKR